MSGCTAPGEGLALDCQLARDPSNGCHLVSSLAEDSLAGKQVNLGKKKSCVISCRGFSYNCD